MKTTAVFALLLLMCCVSAVPVTHVAFSAALIVGDTVTLGPHPENTDLIFKYVPTNIGNAYNAETGKFTAPVKGAYHFMWHVGGHGGELASGVVLRKNQDAMFAAYSHQSDGFSNSGNDIILALETGDTVWLRLWSNNKIYDNHDHHNTFSGYLLFDM